MGRKSRDKGKRGEREAADELARLFNVEARRGVQFAGGTDSPDVMHDLHGVHVEVKRVERLEFHKAVQQAEADAGDNLPVVLYRRNGDKWYAICRLDDLPQLATNLYLTMAANPGGDSLDDDDDEHDESICSRCSGTQVDPSSNRPDDYGPHLACMKCCGREREC